MKSTNAVGWCLLLALGCTGSLDLSADKPDGMDQLDAMDPASDPTANDPPLDNYRPPEERKVLGGPAVGRRLTSEEFLAAIEVATGVTISAGEADLPRDFRSPSTGFRNDTEQQILFAEVAERYQAVAKLASGRMDWNAFLAATTTCTDMSDNCQATFVDEAGLRLLRRPLPQAERDIFLRLFSVVEEEGDGFETAARLIVEAMLQSPRFVYRLEGSTSDMNNPGMVDEFELATRLSFLVWHAGPDQELLALAEAGTLSSQLDVQVERMIAHDRSRQALRNYVEQWLNLDGATANAPLADELKEETQRFFSWLTWEQDASLAQAFTAQTTFVTSAIAEAYDLPMPASDFDAIDLAAVPERIGFLTQPAFIRANSPVASSTAIDRGLFVLRQALCGHIEPPTDPGLLEQIEEQTVPESEGTSQRDRFETQAQNPVCASCHDRFDPLGFALENYATDGTYITQDAYGNSLSGHGSLTLDGTTHDFENLSELAEVLGSSPTVERCFVEKALSQSLGRGVRDAERSWIDELFDSVGATQTTYQNIIRETALHPAFAQQSVEKESP